MRPLTPARLDAHPGPEGLHADLARLAELARRRRSLTMLVGLGTLALAPAAARGAGATCALIESETAGTYPADGTNGNGNGLIDVLTETGIVRSDIRSSFGSFTGTAPGVPLKIEIRVASVSAACAPLAGYAVYVWHCDRDGEYSLYGAPNANYLRGVQQTDAEGRVLFQSIFPACYSGRWPHIHFEVFCSLSDATQGTNSLKTTQMALPKAVCQKVYDNAAGYTASVANLAKVSIATDLVFGDDDALHERPTLMGNASTGYTMAMQIGI